MKNMKKIVALLVAVLMLMSSFAALAADDETPAKVAGLDESVSVTGLMDGDALKLYQVLTWSDTKGRFELATGFTGLTDDTTNFPADEDAKTDREQEVVQAFINGLTQAQVNAIAACTKDIATPKASADIGADASYTYTLEKGTDTKPLHTELGMYMAIITAGTPKYVYNPVLVSADFITNNGYETIDASSAQYNTAVAKRKEITIDKTTADSNEGRTEEDKNAIIATAINSYVGETVDFQVKTTIPVFMESFKNPSFVITDAIKTTGIELVANSIKVKLGDAAASDVYDATNYTVAETGKTGYTVTFKEAYLKANTVPVDVVVTYKGTITSAAEFNVNEDYNDVTVTYSNGPDEEIGALRDETNHYTFSIGAKVFGLSGDEGKTYELVKVGVDADGKPVVAEKLIDDWKTEVKRHPLANAKFGLYTDIGCAETNRYKLGKYADTTTYPDGAEFTTGEDGIISFEGLAAGTYYIKELEAPTGYIKDDRVTAVTIEAHYKNVDVAATTESIGGKDVNVAGYSVEVLDYYTVSVNGVSILENGKYGETNKVDTKYEYNNDGPRTKTLKVEESNINDAEKINTQGVELPSTGGMGTTILYIGGSILVILAAVLLITKRRMNADE